MSFNQNSNGDANPFRDSVPECRWVSQCHLLLEPHGCDHCDHNNPDLLRDEDGEPLRVTIHPERH